MRIAHTWISSLLLTVKTDQNRRIFRPILIFAERTYHTVDSVIVQIHALLVIRVAHIHDVYE